jgi:hypothetical protein
MKHSAFVVALVIAVCIFSSVVSFRHGNHRTGCSLDGSEIERLYEVVIIQKDRLSRSFACVLSARIWFRENSEQVSSVLVTDEVTGEKIRAEDAFYVVSEVVTTPYTGNRIHVFAEKTRAGSHATQFKGKPVKNPFQAEEKIRVLLTEHRTDPQSSQDFLFPSFQNPVSLPAKTALMKVQGRFYLPQEYLTRLSDGFSNPPDKPPRILI